MLLGLFLGSSGFSQSSVVLSDGAGQDFLEFSRLRDKFGKLKTKTKNILSKWGDPEKDAEGFCQSLKSEFRDKMTYDLFRLPEKVCGNNSQSAQCIEDQVEPYMKGALCYEN